MVDDPQMASEPIQDPVVQRLATTGGSDFKVKIGCPCIDKTDIPMTDFYKLSRSFIAYVQDDPLLTIGMPVDQAYELMVEKCIEKGMTHLVTIESDNIVPRNALPKLLTRAIVEGHPFVCGSYVFKDYSDMSVAVRYMPDGRSQRMPSPFERRGLVEIDRACPMGCAVIDLRVVAKLDRPWFKTGQAPNRDTKEMEKTTQDVYFTNKLMLAGHKPMLDTDIQCIHVCRKTYRCFGSPDYVQSNKLRIDTIDELAVRDAPWWLGYQSSEAPIIFDGITAAHTPGHYLVHGISRDGQQRVSIEVSALDLTSVSRALTSVRPPAS